MNRYGGVLLQVRGGGGEETDQWAKSPRSNLGRRVFDEKLDSCNTYHLDCRSTPCVPHLKSTK